MILPPINGKEYIMISTTSMAPARKRVLFVLQHSSSEYWGCEWNSSPLIINAKEIEYEDGECTYKHLSSSSSNDIIQILSRELYDTFLDSQITLERLNISQLERDELKWENEQLALIYNHASKDMDSLSHETAVNDSLMEEYRLMQQLYLQENEFLISENHKLKEKLAMKEDAVCEKDAQILNLSNDNDDFKRENNMLRGRLEVFPTDQLKVSNETLNSKVSYLESKYIDTFLNSENAKIDNSLLRQRLKLVEAVIPKDYGESVGLLLDFLMLFTRLKSKCLLLTRVTELNENLRIQRNLCPQSVKFLMMMLNFTKGECLFDLFSKAVMRYGYSSEWINKAFTTSKCLESSIDSLIQSASTKDLTKVLDIEEFSIGLQNLQNLLAQLVKSRSDDYLIHLDTKNLIRILQTNVATLSNILNLAKLTLEHENDRHNCDTFISMLSGLHIKMISIVNSDKMFNVSRKYYGDLNLCMQKMDEQSSKLSEALFSLLNFQYLADFTRNDSVLKTIIAGFSATDSTSDLNSITQTIQNLHDLVDQFMSFSQYVDHEQSGSDLTSLDNWKSIVSSCHARYCDVSMQEKRISLLESEISSQSLLERRIKDLMAKAAIHGHNPQMKKSVSDSTLNDATENDALNSRSELLQELSEENQRLREIISKKKENDKISFENINLEDYAAIRDILNMLWRENLQLKLNLSKWNALDLSTNFNPSFNFANDIAQLRQIQRKIRLQKLNSLRILNLNTKIASRKVASMKKNNELCSKLEDTNQKVKKIRDCHSVDQHFEPRLLRGRLFIKDNSNEYNITKKIHLDSDCAGKYYFRSLLSFFGQ